MAIHSPITLDLRGRRIAFGDGPPASSDTSRRWEVGDRIVNSAETPGEPPAWRCVTAGSPGTWEPIVGGHSFRTLAADGPALVSDDVILASTGGATVAVTLPLAAATAAGKELKVIRSGANNATVVRAGADTIGAAGVTLTFAADNDSATLISDGVSKWLVSSLGDLGVTGASVTLA